MRKLILAVTLCVFSINAWAQAIYLQGSQTPGVLAVPKDATGTVTAGVPYVNADGTAALGATQACRLYHTGGTTNNSATAANTDQTPVITEVYIAEVLVTMPCTATGVATYNGSVASGNLKVGLANRVGTVVATSASTASAGTTSYQRVPFTAPVALVPGTYYVLTFYDNTTVRPTAWTAGNFGASKQTGQTYATGFTTVTPPTTFTTALGPVASLY